MGAAYAKMMPNDVYEEYAPAEKGMLVANGKGPHPTVILLHGYPGNEKNLDLAQSLRRAGYNVVFLHYRGAWGSQGDYSIGGQADDVAAVLGYVRENADRLRAVRVLARAEDVEVAQGKGLHAIQLGEDSNVGLARELGRAIGGQRPGRMGLFPTGLRSLRPCA